MNLTLDDEQQILKDGAHEFFKERSPVKALRALRDTGAPLGYDPAVWAEMAALGWAGILIPEDLGGAGFGYKGFGQVMEEAGRTLAASPLASTALIAAPLLLATADAARKEALLPAIARGELVIALALDEAPRHAPERIATRAVRNAGGYVLNGCKTFVIDGHVAQSFIVVARTAGDTQGADGLSLFLVDAKTQGVTVTRTRMVDSRNAAQVSFSDVALPADALRSDNDEAIDRGALLVVDNLVDQSTGTVRLKAEFPNADLKLWPGQFVNVRLLVDTLKQAVVVPTGAVQRGPKGAFVYAIKADSTVTMRMIAVGRQDETQATIVSGLAPGERVVTTGFVNLSDGTRISVSPGADAAPADGDNRPRGERGRRPGGGAAR